MLNSPEEKEMSALWSLLRPRTAGQTGSSKNRESKIVSDGAPLDSAGGAKAVKLDSIIGSFVSNPFSGSFWSVIRGGNVFLIEESKAWADGTFLRERKLNLSDG